MEGSLGGRIEELRQAFGASQQQMIEARAKLNTLTARAESRDGRILVVLNSQGQITTLTFRGDAHCDLDGNELSERILAVVNEASARLRRNVAEVMPRSPWGGLSVEEMLDPATDLAQLVPESLFAVSPRSQADAMKRGRRG